MFSVYMRITLDNGERYVSRNTQIHGSCYGCALTPNTTKCKELSSAIVAGCVGLIWEKDTSQTKKETT